MAANEFTLPTVSNGPLISNKALGIIGMLFAPCLYLGWFFHAPVPNAPKEHPLMASLFGRKNPPPQPETPASNPTVLAYATSDAAEAASVLPAPLPPRRPQELLASATTEVLSEPRDTLTTASLPVQGAIPDTTSVLGFDEKAAVRALFEPKASLLDLGFSRYAKDELSTTQFTGPAVKPLPVLGQLQASL